MAETGNISIKKVILTNPRGMHLRQVGAIVHVLESYTSSVSLLFGKRTADGRSTLSLLSLAAPFNSEIEIHAEGEDAESACEAVAHVMTHPIED